MKEVYIKLDSINKVKKFNNTVNKFTKTEFDLVSSRYVVDAKSIMSIFSLDLSNDLKLVIHTDDEKLLNNIINEISEFVVNK